MILALINLNRKRELLCPCFFFGFALIQQLIVIPLSQVGGPAQSSTVAALDIDGLKRSRDGQHRIFAYADRDCLTVHGNSFTLDAAVFRRQADAESACRAAERDRSAHILILIDSLHVYRGNAAVYRVSPCLFPGLIHALDLDAPGVVIL